MISKIFKTKLETFAR